MIAVITTAVIATLLVAGAVGSHSSAGPAKRTWFGPVTVSFNVKFPGNPYDPAENDVTVRFTNESGASLDRIAFYDGPAGWKATLVAPNKGRYKAVLIRNGERTTVQPNPAEVVLETPIAKGYVRRDPDADNRFMFDDGERFYPIGHDLAWPSQTRSIPDQLKMMHDAGLTWARIWAASWSSMNPWWPNDEVVPPGQLWLKALQNWQTDIDAAEADGIKFQFVLFNHGLFSSTVNPNWPGHPWNAANGGFLKSATAFFTDPEAKKRTKMWLRYAVARWAHSPSVMAWELFNEIEWVDAMRYAPDTVFAWHKEMAAYLRQIDPYGHLVTTSSTMEPTHLWDAMDYYQPHTYPVDVTTAVSGIQVPPGKPLFFGEFGSTNGPSSGEKRVIRDGVYAAMLANHAGTAMYWSWDRVDADHLYGEYKQAVEILKASKLAAHDRAKPLAVDVSTAGQGELVFRPGLGWTKTEQFAFDLPADVDAKAMNRVSSFLQSQTGGNSALCPQPLDFTFDAKSDGTASLHIVTLSRGGAHVHLLLDGTRNRCIRRPGGRQRSPGERHAESCLRRGPAHGAGRKRRIGLGRFRRPHTVPVRPGREGASPLRDQLDDGESHEPPCARLARTCRPEGGRRHVQPDGLGSRLGQGFEIQSQDQGLQNPAEPGTHGEGLHFVVRARVSGMRESDASDRSDGSDRSDANTLHPAPQAPKPHTPHPIPAPESLL